MTNTLAGKETKGCRLSFGSPWVCPMLVPAAITMLALGMFSQPEHFSVWIQKEVFGLSWVEETDGVTRLNRLSSPSSLHDFFLFSITNESSVQYCYI